MLPKVRTTLLILGIATVSGCFAFVPWPDEPLSVAYTNGGYLRNGVAIEDRGRGFVRSRPGEETASGVPAMVSLIERTASHIDEMYPGTMPMRVGDLSYPCGGRHPRHGSHRSGRDVDIIFYAVDSTGDATRGRGWVAYDRFGTAQGSRRDEEMVFFDDARNWALVEYMVMDEEARVQWLFVSRGVKARLLRYAMASGANPEAIYRASLVLQQPSRSSPHADHFHVRIYCGEAEAEMGCIDRAPIWPWHRRMLDESPAALRLANTSARATDEMITGELVRPLAELSEN